MRWDKSPGATRYEVSIEEFPLTPFWRDVGDVSSYTFTGLDFQGYLIQLSLDTVTDFETLQNSLDFSFYVRSRNSAGFSSLITLIVPARDIFAPAKSRDDATATPTFTPSPKPTVHTLKQLPAEIQVNNWLDGAQGRRVGVAEIGRADIIQQGVLDAVDVFGYVSPGVEVCFAQYGRIVFLDAAYAPRRAFDLSAYQRAERTCALIDRAGTVVLLRGDSPPPLSTPPASTNSNQGRGLGECEVRPFANLKVRKSPPDGLVLGVTASRDWLRASDKRAGYFKVSLWGIEGWISGDYVNTRGDCGA